MHFSVSCEALRWINPLLKVCAFELCRHQPLWASKMMGFKKRRRRTFSQILLMDVEKSGGENQLREVGSSLSHYLRRQVLLYIHFRWLGRGFLNTNQLRHARSLTTCPPSVSIATKPPTPGPYQATLVPNGALKRAGSNANGGPMVARSAVFAAAKKLKSCGLLRKKNELCEIVWGLNESILRLNESILRFTLQKGSIYMVYFCSWTFWVLDGNFFCPKMLQEIKQQVVWPETGSESEVVVLGGPFYEPACSVHFMDVVKVKCGKNHHIPWFTPSFISVSNINWWEII